MKNLLRTQRNKRTGFTLIELLLAMGILSILMVIIFRVFIQIIEMQLDAEAESAVSQDARYIYSRLTYDINRADTISVPASAGASGASMALTVGATTYTYQVDGGGNLTVNDGSGTVQLNSAGSRAVSALFTRRGGATGAHSITFDIDIESKIPLVTGNAVRSINSTVGTR